MTEKTDILSLSYAELVQAVEQAGEKKFRAGQIYSWLHVKKVSSVDEMTNLSASLRLKLNDLLEEAGAIIVDSPKVKSNRGIIHKDTGTVEYEYKDADFNLSLETLTKESLIKLLSDK